MYGRWFVRRLHRRRRRRSSSRPSGNLLSSFFLSWALRAFQARQTPTVRVQVIGRVNTPVHALFLSSFLLNVFTFLVYFFQFLIIITNYYLKHTKTLGVALVQQLGCGRPVYPVSFSVCVCLMFF